MTRLLPFLMMARASGLAGGFLKKAADTLRAASGGPPPPALQLDAAPSWDALQQTLDAQTPAEEIEIAKQVAAGPRKLGQLAPNRAERGPRRRRLWHPSRLCHRGGRRCDRSGGVLALASVAADAGSERRATGGGAYREATFQAVRSGAWVGVGDRARQDLRCRGHTDRRVMEALGATYS